MFNVVAETEKGKFQEDFGAAVKENNIEKAAKIMTDFYSTIESNIIAESKAFNVENADEKTLQARGLRILTTAEKSYFNKVIDAARSTDSTKAFEGLSDVMPDSEVNAIFDDMSEAHPLLKTLKFTNTAALTKFVLNAAGPVNAVWGELNSKITKEIEGAVDLVTINLGKLSAFMQISNDMLDLGPVWVEKYIRTALSEALAGGIVDGILNGKGIKGEPIGAKKDISSDVQVSQETGHPDKKKIVITDLSAKTYGKILAQMAKSETGRARTISKVIFVVNPVDYFNLIMPATTYLTNNGIYARDVVPFPTDFIQEPAVAEGEAIIGIGEKYFFGIGAGTNGGKIEDDKSISQFLEDVRNYKVKFYGAGRALDDNCFKLLDISNILPSQEEQVAESTDSTPVG